MNENRVADSIKKMVIGSIIAEYGALEIIGDVDRDLKQRVSGVIRTTNHVQDFFRHRGDASPEIREVFKKNFLKDEYLLISEILVAIWNFDEKSLEGLLESIKNNTDEGEPVESDAEENMSENYSDALNAERPHL